MTSNSELSRHDCKGKYNPRKTLKTSTAEAVCHKFYEVLWGNINADLINISDVASK